MRARGQWQPQGKDEEGARDQVQAIEVHHRIALSAGARQGIYYFPLPDEAVGRILPNNGRNKEIGCGNDTANGTSGGAFAGH